MLRYRQSDDSGLAGYGIGGFLLETVSISAVRVSLAAKEQVINGLSAGAVKA